MCVLTTVVPRVGTRIYVNFDQPIDKRRPARSFLFIKGDSNRSSQTEHCIKHIHGSPFRMVGD